MFANAPGAPSHQIGGCDVVGDQLYVGVGDGNDIGRAGDVNKLVGKIVRMSVDGAPVADNPFFRGAKSREARYVYALGLRNPFGVKHVNSELFSVQNGSALDTFFRVDRGADYGWNGTDASVASNALSVITPSVGPVQLDYYSGGSLFPKEYASTFFFATSTFSEERGAGVMAVGYDFDTNRVTRPHESFVLYRKQTGGEVAATALGTDGLYFAPLNPGPSGTSSVLRVSYDSSADYPHVIGAESSGAGLVASYGCSSCHVLNGKGGRVGPSLDKGSLEDRLYLRLNSADYVDSVARIDALGREPFSSFRDARHEVLAASEFEKAGVWIKYKLIEPRFDNPNARMPKLGLSEDQATAVSEYLLGIERAAPVATESFSDRATRVLKSKRFALGLAAGLCLAAVAFASGWLLFNRRTSRV